MEEEKKHSGVMSYLETLTLGVSRLLETFPGVTDVNFREKHPAERHMIVSWELKNNCILPDDLKNFYLTTDGFYMTWSIKFEDYPMQLGSIVINSISKLNQLGLSSMYNLPNAPTLADLEDDLDEEEAEVDKREQAREKPHFDFRNLIFELDSCNGNGKVCLVYRVNKTGLILSDTEIWFLDRALYWHFLTDTFTAYYRLLITHLGLPQWQYIFTNYGVSPQAKQWLNMYKPIIFNPVLLSEEKEAFLNKLDPSKVFKSKIKTPVIKTKLPAQTTVSQKGHTSTVSSRNILYSGNTIRK